MFRSNSNDIKRKRYAEKGVTACILTVLLTLSATAFYLSPQPSDYIPVGLAGYMHTVVIDAGHGGIDGGAVSQYTDMTEAQINLDIARALEKKLSGCGVGVVMTRRDENSLASSEGKHFKRRDMDARLEIAKSVAPDLLVSIHINKYSGAARRGAQVFYKSGSGGKDAAAAVQQSLNSGINLPFLDREYNSATGDYYLLNKAPCPAIIVECGFISSPRDAELLSKREYREYVAEVVSLGVLTYLLSEKT